MIVFIILIFKLYNLDFNDLIHNQFTEKHQAVHSNYVAESLNFLQIVSIMFQVVIKIA